MAIDRNALDAITGERKGKKNQSRFEDRPKPPKGVGERLYESVAKIPGAIAGIPGKILDVVEGQKSPTYDVNQAARNFEGLVTKNLPEAVERIPKALGEAPGKIADIVSNYVSGRKTQPSGQYTGVMTRDVPKPGIGQVGVGGSMPIPPAIAGDRAALTATERMRPDQSPRQLQAPTVEPLTPSYVQSDAANKRDALRAQIAAEQQQMLRARRMAEGARRRGVEIEPFNEGASLKKIAEMRSELAGYEKAAAPIQQIKVKTAEQNLATEQDVARQAADIMQRDVEDLRYQLNLMPEGQAKAAMQERLRSLEYQQQQQSARGRVLAPTEVGPQVRGASPELYQQMLQEGEARTQRQREAAPRVAARQEALGEAAYRAAEGQQAGRLQAQQRQADFESAIQKARISEIGAPEQERELRRRAAESGIAESGARLKESEARTEAIRIEAASKAAESALRLKKGNFDLAAQEYNFQMEKEFGEPMRKLALERAKFDQKMAEQKMRFSPELQAERNAFSEQAMKTAGVTPGKYELALKAANDIKSEAAAFDGKEFRGSFWTGSAEGATQASKHIINYVESLKRLSIADPDSAKRLAGDLITSMPEFEEAGGIADFSNISGILAGYLPFVFQRTNQPDREALVVRLKAANETLRELTQ